MTKERYAELKQKVRDAVVERKLTGRQIAREIGEAESYVSYVLSPTALRSPRMLLIIAEHLGVA